MVCAALSKELQAVRKSRDSMAQAGAVCKSFDLENKDIDVKKRTLLDNIANLETRSKFSFA